MVEEVNVCREVIPGIKTDVRFGRLPKIDPGRIQKENAVRNNVLITPSSSGGPLFESVYWDLGMF